MAAPESSTTITASATAPAATVEIVLISGAIRSTIDNGGIEIGRGSSPPDRHLKQIYLKLQYGPVRKLHRIVYARMHLYAQS